MTRVVSIPGQYNSTPVFDAHPKAGICEVHLGWAENLMSIRGPADFVGKNAIHTALVSDADCVACKKCRDEMVDKYKSVHVTSELDIYGQAVEHRYLPKAVQQVVGCALEIQDTFPQLIENIYLIPDDSAPEGFKNKVNIVFCFTSFSTLSYLLWAVTTGQSLFSIWTNNAEDRTKFFSEIQTRIILGLAKIHHVTKNTAIWVMGYDRIISIEAFSVTPPRILKLNRPYKLLRVKRNDTTT